MRRNYEFYGFNGSLNFNLAAKAADFYGRHKEEKSVKIRNEVAKFKFLLYDKNL